MDAHGAHSGPHGPLFAGLIDHKATHLVGGEMYYDHLGGDNYEVHLIIYRDCGPTNTNGTGSTCRPHRCMRGKASTPQAPWTSTQSGHQHRSAEWKPLCRYSRVCIERAEYVSTPRCRRATRPTPSLPALLPKPAGHQPARRHEHRLHHVRGSASGQLSPGNRHGVQLLGPLCRTASGLCLPRPAFFPRPPRH